MTRRKPVTERTRLDYLEENYYDFADYRKRHEGWQVWDNATSAFIGKHASLRAAVDSEIKRKRELGEEIP